MDNSENKNTLNMPPQEVFKSQPLGSSNRKVVYLIVAIVIIIFSTVILIATLGKSIFSPNNMNNKITLTMWEVGENQSVYQSLINEYEKQNPNITINYVTVPSAYYASTLYNKIKSGQGVPDIVSIPNSFVPYFSPLLYSAPNSIFPVSLLESKYYPIFQEELTVNNKLYAIPTYYDGLALLYNKSEYASANLQGPSSNLYTFEGEIPQLVNRNSNQAVTQAAIDIGGSENTYDAGEILSLFMQINKTVMVSNGNANFASQNGQEALSLYQNIQNQDGWNSTFPSAIPAFANGTVASIFATASDIKQIMQINPNLNLGVSQPPQIPGGTINIPIYNAQAVPINSKNPEQAWKFLRFLSQQQNLLTIFKNRQSNGEVVGALPRIDMSQDNSQFPFATVFEQMESTSSSWYEGDPEAVNSIFDDVIDGNLTLAEAQQKVQGIYDKIANGIYSIPTNE